MHSCTAHALDVKYAQNLGWKVLGTDERTILKRISRNDLYDSGMDSAGYEQGPASSCCENMNIRVE
jgi:hypothetical protein